MRFSAVAILITALFPAPAPDHQKPQAVGTTENRQTRTVMPLMQNWKFTLDDSLTDAAALSSSGSAWDGVTLPHSWNAEDAASLRATTYKRGVGWYRLEFDTPAEGARHWLEFGAASLVADVWLNGDKLGQHKGGFTMFRFDVTDRLKASGRNVLLVKVNNTQPTKEDDVTAIAPLGGDFNVSGGLYRHVSMVSTPDPVHIDLGDMGGPGIYAATTSIADGTATVNVRSKLKSDANEDGQYVVRASMLHADNQVAQSAEDPVALKARANAEVSQNLKIDNAHLWRGVEDPYRYTLVVEVLKDGKPIDRVTHAFGIREMRFDPADGFFLNGEHLRLRGVAMHQDFLGKAWATSNPDIDTSFDLIMEIGANAVRLGHYPFSQYALEKASSVGLISWAETALGLGTTVQPCSKQPASAAFVENAKQQLQEVIRQQYNYPAISMWSIGNETTARQNNCKVPYDNVTPVLRELHAVAKKEDPTRATAYAEFGHPVNREGVFATERITDVFATNRYFAWYTATFEDLDPLIDDLHALAYDQSLGISEYGAGADITHHSDNPRGGYPDRRSAPKGEIAYQPEEYASDVHERNYRVISSKPYLWGSFVWNMFDFGSAHRNEGDVLGVNTKGLVTFDRKTRKDPFFFYKANWAAEPVTYITGRRYIDRAYALTHVKVYSNAESVDLSLNGQRIASMHAAECPQKTCLFKDVHLRRGENTLTAVGKHGAQSVTDTVGWTLTMSDVNIASGWVATGYVSADGARFGSDNFYMGGRGVIVEDDSGEIGPENLTGKTTALEGTRDPLLFRHLRTGTFAYDIPLENGNYQVTLGFLESDRTATAGARVFDVKANGETKLAKMDVLKEARGQPRTAITRSFPVAVSDGRLRLDFLPVTGEAIVSNIRISPAGPASPQPR